MKQHFLLIFAMSFLFANCQNEDRPSDSPGLAIHCYGPDNTFVPDHLAATCCQGGQFKTNPPDECMEALDEDLAEIYEHIFFLLDEVVDPSFRRAAELADGPEVKVEDAPEENEIQTFTSNRSQSTAAIASAASAQVENTRKQGIPLPPPLDFKKESPSQPGGSAGPISPAAGSEFSIGSVQTSGITSGVSEDSRISVVSSGAYESGSHEVQFQGSSVQPSPTETLGKEIEIGEKKPIFSEIQSSDPKNYFKMTRLGDNLFKIVERRYQKKSKTWFNKDLKIRLKQSQKLTESK